ncbi:hypothetical protein ACLOJK_013255 [Asimina triloba]
MSLVMSIDDPSGLLTFLNKSDIPLPSDPQREERIPPHNSVATRLLLVVGAPPLEDRAPSNSLDPSGENPNGLVTRAKFHALSEMMKSLLQQMIRVQPDATSIPSACVPSPLAATATSQPHPSSTLKAPDENNPLALYLQMQPILDRFQIPKMTIFGPTSDPTGQVVNYNIRLDFRTASEGLKCRVFYVALDEQGKMWFASLALDSITRFRQFTDLFEARFSNQRQRLIIAAQLMCGPRDQTNHCGTT